MSEEGNINYTSNNNKALVLIEELREKLNKSIVVFEHNDYGDDKINLKPKIQKVPGSLRGQKKSEKYYEPRWMSIGPIHHGNPKYRLAEDYKVGLAARFIRGGGYQTWEDMYRPIEDRMAGLALRYSDEAIEDFRGLKHIDHHHHHHHRNQESSIEWLLFFDGCAILQFVHGCCGGDELGMKNDQVAFTQHDIFLLENQIPFRVLELLIESRPSDSALLRRSITTFVGMNAMAPPKFQRLVTEELLDRDPDHLLHLLLLALVEKPKKKRIRKRKPNPVVVVGDQDKKAEEGSSTVSIRIPNEKQDYRTTENGHNNNLGLKEQQSFRSVTDLSAAGITLRPSATSSLGDIRFSSRGFVATLELPPVIIDDLTGSKFMNLIAYEMCPDNKATKYEVTSYISFLDSLIDYPADVKELRSACVLHNLLGCDNEVARLFNKIGTDLVPNPRVYEAVIDNIERHYKKKLTTWMAQVLNDHFSSPWTIVTFLAAVLALSLAIIDTWINVKNDTSKRES